LKYVLKHCKEGEDVVEYLNSVSKANHTIEGMWSTPAGVYCVVCFWDETA
jgi:hypothetical protein